MKLLDFIDKKTVIDTKEWKPFVVGELFDFPKVKKYPKIDKSSGNTPFVSCKGANNGIANLCGLEPNCKNAITVSTNGTSFNCFYHDYEFVASTDVEIIQNPNMTKNSALFICCILNREHKKYNWTKKAKNGFVAKTVISLPTDKFGNPDWDYMDNFIQERERERDAKENLAKILVKNLSKTKINTSSWKEFSINSSPFYLYSSNSTLDKNKIVNLGLSEFNYVTRTDNMNGILFKIPKQKNANLNDSKCLTIGLDTQTVFYQSDPFYTGQNVHILRVEGASKNSYLYIATILKKVLSSRFYWGNNGATLGRLKEIKIKFPCTDDGKLDFDYMDKYINSLKVNSLV